MKKPWLVEGLASNINENFLEIHTLLNSAKVVDLHYRPKQQYIKTKDQKLSPVITLKKEKGEGIQLLTFCIQYLNKLIHELINV